MRHVFMLLALAVLDSAHAQPLPTELEDCTGDGANFCFDGVPALIDSGCGAVFEGYQGRVGWPALENIGPVTISVQTVSTSFDGQTFLPLYVEIRDRTDPLDGTHCSTQVAGQVVLVARGAIQCGGTWESIGPVDLASYGVPLGGAYSLQCVFFRTTPDEVTIRSIGFSCIRVTTTVSAIRQGDWTAMKRLYQ